jgi:DNA polymerase-3 subunit beta
MKFTAPCSELQKALSTIGGVIPSKSTLPILENFLFEVSKDTLKITATDLDTAMSITMKVKNGADGKLAIPAKRLTETIRSLPSADINFTANTDNNKIVMSTSNGEYKLTGESSDNYPSAPSFKGSGELTISDENLSRLIGKTSFAVSSDELRPAMMGILFQIKKNEIRTVATDGHRLVRIVNTGVATTTAEKEIIIPAKAMNLVLKSLGSGESTIAFNESHVMFSRDSVTLISRMIEEKYPNYESVIPLDNDKQLTVNRNELIASVRRTALYASSTTHQVRLALKKNSLTISAEDIDFGSEAKETIKCDYTSDALEIGFNSAYIIDILSHMDNDEIMMMFSSPTRASIVKPVNQRNGENLLMLVMPVRLNN